MHLTYISNFFKYLRYKDDRGGVGRNGTVVVQKRGGMGVSVGGLCVCTCEIHFSISEETHTEDGGTRGYRRSDVVGKQGAMG